MINLITLKELSIKKQIDQSSVLREILQIAWLNQFYRLPAGRRVWFKGGTCLKLLYGSNRFSEDFEEQILIKDINQFLPKSDRQILSKLKSLLLQKLKYAVKT